MLGWVHQPAGTQSASPGRAVGGPRRLGCRVNVKYNRTAELSGRAGFGGKAGLRGFGQTGLGQGESWGCSWAWPG